MYRQHKAPGNKSVLLLLFGYSKTLDNNKSTLHYYTSGKNHFHEMNGDVGMARWK